MEEKLQNIAPVLPGRINSVDFYRGLTMFLLAGESTLLYEHFSILTTVFCISLGLNSAIMHGTDCISGI